MKSSNPGAVSEEECTECGANTYSAAGATQCEICPAFTSAPARSDALDDCKCLAGYQSNVAGLDGRPCSACLAGKHKALTGASPCIDCAVNKYSTAVAATSDATCESCTQNAVSPAASSVLSQCLCDRGFKLESGPTLSAIDNLARSCGVNSNQACPTQVDSARAGECPEPCALRANDGLYDSSIFTNGNLINSVASEIDAWWMVDFQRPVTVSVVKLWPARWDSPGIPGGLYTGPNMFITVGNTPIFNSPNNAECFREPLPTQLVRTVTCTQPLAGRYLFVQQRGWNPRTGYTYYGNGFLQFSEIEPQQAAVITPGTCVACTAGTFKDTLGSAECTN
jgi:hypothetical protein